MSNIIAELEKEELVRVDCRPHTALVSKLFGRLASDCLNAAFKIGEEAVQIKLNFEDAG